MQMNKQKCVPFNFTDKCDVHLKQLNTLPFRRKVKKKKEIGHFNVIKVIMVLFSFIASMDYFNVICSMQKSRYSSANMVL